MVGKSSKEEAPARARIRVSPVVVGGILYGIVATLIALSTYFDPNIGTYGFWGVTTAESQMGGAIWRALGFPVDQLGYYQEFKIPENPLIRKWSVVFGILLGTFFATLARRRFQIVVPNKWLALQAMIGGILIGYGTRLGAGCNLGNFMSGWASGSLIAPIFTLAMIAGVYVGWRFIVERYFIYRAGPSKVVRVPGGVQLAAAIAVAVVAVVLISLAPGLADKAWLVGGMAVGAIGSIFGVCYYTSFRETANFTASVKRGGYEAGVMIPAIIALLLTYAILSQILILGLGIPASFSGPMKYGIWHQLLGGFIFGLGMALAANCVYGIEWRMGTGALYTVIGFLSMILIGMPLLALHWDWWKAVLGTLPHPPMFDSYYRWSLYYFGVPGAVAVDLMLIAWLLWWRKTYR